MSTLRKARQLRKAGNQVSAKRKFHKFMLGMLLLQCTASDNEN